MSTTQFVPLSSSADAGFWNTLSQKKVNELQLDESPQDILGSYANGGMVHSQSVPPRLVVDGDAWRMDSGSKVSSPLRCYVPGRLHIQNTFEGFKGMDRAALFAGVASDIWSSIQDGSAASDPSLLQRFLLLCYADLKKHKFYYWFAFPGLVLEPLVVYTQAPKPLIQELSEIEMHALRVGVFKLNQVMSDTKPASWNGCRHGAFLVGLSAAAVDSERTVSVTPLSDWERMQTTMEQVILAFIDPSSTPNHPGWPLRNALAWVTHAHPEVCGIDGGLPVLAYREVFPARQCPPSDTHPPGSSHAHGRSILFRVHLKAHSVVSAATRDLTLPKAVGWEKGIKGKMGPRVIDLGSMMDPKQLAETGVDLNLRLMRWRLLPSLKLDTLSSLRVLILGAGTVGCNVARCLLGWGVRHISFVDNGRVSFSNPVRQTLFDFKDCVDGGQDKAPCAAARCEAIFPGCQAHGHVMSIPMPGHSVSTTPSKSKHSAPETPSPHPSGSLASMSVDVPLPPGSEAERIQRACVELEHLIVSHDVVYLATDSRESRWLPTLMCAWHRCLCLNVALGFDSYLAMRHGVPAADGEDVPGVQLGCYFCTDIVAPSDSLTDRTLDQQCTVTRPGLSMMASAAAVELMVSVLHSPLQGRCLPPSQPGGPSSDGADVSEAEEPSPLGVVPHQIRGFLNQFRTMLMESEPYSQCTACSNKVLEAFREHGYSFLLRAFNEPTYLEDLTGLSKMKQDADEMMDACDWDSDDDGFVSVS